MSDWKSRLKTEAVDLSEKLNVFLADDENLSSLTNKQVALVLAQSHAMTNYLNILHKRLDQ